MKTKLGIAASAALIAMALTSPRAHAWGQYGHEQVNDAAIDVLGTSNGLGKCFDEGRYVIRRLAITPDMEWKTDLSIDTLSPEDKSKRLDDNQYEHQLHFDEADAWVPNPKPGELAALPSGEYKDVFEFYRGKVKENVQYIDQMDPNKKVSNPASPTVNDVTDHGSAPWRALQLFRLGVEALKKKDVKAAMLYLGTMGHYVGDMTQPFHATLNFDGEQYSSPAAGIHHEIDTGTLPAPSKDANDVYSSFDETDAGVVDAARKSISSVDGLKEGEIVSEILKNVDSGYPDVDGFLKTYSEFCASAQAGGGGKMPVKPRPKKGGGTTARLTRSPGRSVAMGKGRKKGAAPATSLEPAPAGVPEAEPGPVSVNPPHRDPRFQGNGGHGATPDRTTGNYCELFVSADPSRAPSARPLPAATERQFAAKIRSELVHRLGLAAGLLARIWAAAYEAAGRPELSGCAGIAFDQSYAIQNYPKPVGSAPYGYLPDGYVPGQHN